LAVAPGDGNFSIDIGAAQTQAENFRAIIGGRRKIRSATPRLPWSWASSRRRRSIVMCGYWRDSKKCFRIYREASRGSGD